MAKNSSAKIQANNRYTAKAYDRLNIFVPKGQKALIEAAAKEAGESVNSFTQGALLARLGLETWPGMNNEREEE